MTGGQLTMQHRKPGVLAAKLKFLRGESTLDTPRIRRGVVHPIAISRRALLLFQIDKAGITPGRTAKQISRNVICGWLYVITAVKKRVSLATVASTFRICAS